MPRNYGPGRMTGGEEDWAIAHHRSCLERALHQELTVVGAADHRVADVKVSWLTARARA